MLIFLEWIFFIRHRQVLESHLLEVVFVLVDFLGQGAAVGLDLLELVLEIAQQGLEFSGFDN